MLNIFTLANGRLVQEEIESLEELSQFQPIWVDLESPRWTKSAGFRSTTVCPSPKTRWTRTSRNPPAYEEGNGELHIRSDTLIDDHEQPVRCAWPSS